MTEPPPRVNFSATANQVSLLSLSLCLSLCLSLSVSLSLSLSLCLSLSPSLSLSFSLSLSICSTFLLMVCSIVIVPFFLDGDL